MSKDSASNCTMSEQDNKVIDDNAGEEGNISEDKSRTNTNYHYRESSSDDNLTDSDSDAESSSGNRVTPDMVLLLMLKETGAITEEKYNEKAETCPYNFKSLIPRLPRSLLLANINNTEDINLENDEKAKTTSTGDNDRNILSKKDTNDDYKVSVSNCMNMAEDRCTTNEVVINAEQNAGCDLSKYNVSGDTTSKDECDQEIIPTKQVKVDMGIKDAGLDKELQNDHALLETSRKELSQEILQTDTVESVDTEKAQDESQNEDQYTKKEFSNARGKITKSFKYILDELIREKRIPKYDEDEYGADYATVLDAYVDDLDDYYENNTAHLHDDEEDTNLTEFAFYLNFYSPSSYKYVVETYNTPLPELKVLYSWYLNDNDTGLTERAFQILKEKSKVKRQTCALMFIDVFLKNEGDEYDQVDYGNNQNYACEDRAVLVYAFILVSLDEDWKIPIGHVYARNVPVETQAELVRICLTHCHEAGADVVAVTMDSPEPAEFLGCNFEDPRKLKTTFKHPSCDRDVAVWIDPCLALKSARQLLNVKGVLEDDRDYKVRWSVLRNLRKLHSDNTINLGKPKYFALRNHIAKSGLTTDTFSESLVPALRLGEKLLPHIFRPTDTEPTVRYITVINELYNILNTRTIANFDEVKKQLYAAKKYLIAMFFNENNAISLFDKDNLNWKRLQGYRYFLKDEPLCGIIAFLICIESFKHLHVTLVQKNIINCLNPKRLSKEHAENFVANLRAYYSDLDPQNLSGEKFQSFYQNLFDELEKNPKFSGKSVSLEHWHLQDRYAPAVTIKLTSGKRSYDDVYSSRYKLKKLKKTTDIEDATKLLREYSKALDVEIDLSTRKKMVGYLAGWIAAKFARSIRCEACIDALCTDKKLWFHEFITFKRIYALCLPSEELFRVCWEAEKTLRFKRNPASVRAWVVRSLSQKFPWGSRTVPQSQQHHLYHRGLLARAVLAKYTALRVPAPFSKKDTANIVEHYQRFTTEDPGGLTKWLNCNEKALDRKM